MLKKNSFIVLVCSAVGIISTLIIIGSLGEHELSNIMAIVGGTSLITGVIALILFFIGIAQEHQKKIQEYSQNGYSETNPVLKKKNFVQKLCDDPKEEFQKQQAEKEFANSSINTQFESQQIPKSNKTLEKNILEKRHIISAQQKNDPLTLLNMIDHVDSIINKTEENTLHLACKYNYIELAQLLLDKEANFHAQDKTGRTPLHTCAMNNSIDIAKLLIDNGARAGILNNAGETPLHKSAEKDFVEISELFLQTKSILLNAPTREGKTPLHLAISKGCLNTTKYLLDCGASKQLKDSSEHIPFQYVTHNRETRIKLIELLGNYGFNINMRYRDGSTILHTAVSQKDCEFIIFLVTQGIDTKIKTIYGDTALSWAKEDKNKEIIKLLQ